MRGEEAGEARRVECFFRIHNSTLANSTLATQRSPAALGADDPFFFLPFACACFGASPGGLRWAWGFSS